MNFPSVLPIFYDIYQHAEKFKGATKSYFTHYSCVVIILFNTALCRSSFSKVSFRKLVFGLPVLSLNQDIKTCVTWICSFVLTLYKNSPFINNKLFTKVLQHYVKTCFQRCFEFFKYKECKNFIIKKSATKVFQVCKIKVYDSFILELSISISISTTLLLWR